MPLLLACKEVIGVDPARIHNAFLQQMLAELNALLLSIAERGAIARADSAAAFADLLRKRHDSGFTLIDPSTTIDAGVSCAPAI